MGKVIWPAKGEGKLVTVEDSTYDLAHARIKAQFATRGDDVWEIVRAVLQSEDEARERRARHARGDYLPEIREAADLTDKITKRTDGRALRVALRLEVLLRNAVTAGFDSHDAETMLAAHGDLTGSLHQTTEYAARLGVILRELKGTGK